MWVVTRLWPQEEVHRFALDLEANIELPERREEKPWVGERVWRAILSIWTFRLKSSLQPGQARHI